MGNLHPTDTTPPVAALPARVFVVDDEPGICRALERILRGRGATVESFARAEDLLEALAGEGAPPDLILLDVRLPGLSGLDALLRMRADASRPMPPVIVMTAHGTLDVAVEALRRGALDYLPKPLDLDAVVGAMERALQRVEAPLPASGETSVAEGTPVGHSAIMQEVFRRIAAVSLSDVPVLITGESGTGKELVARAVHRASRRSGGPFEAVDCASLPESLLESELFGHERGAFTGAVQRRTGRLERAEGGTLFLDEVGEIPPASQAKLLRFLETRTFERLGGEGPITVDTRIVAATNRDLEVGVAEGRFREDLYYRLHVVPIRVPALRDRPGDIPLLVAHFLRRSEDPCRVSPAALDALLAHTWPGNVRELRNAVDHARVMARGGVIQPSHLPGAVTGPAAGASQTSADDERLRAMVSRWASEDSGKGDLHEVVMGRLESHLLREILSRCGGNQVQAAKLLGIHRTTLRERMTRYGLDS